MEVNGLTNEKPHSGVKLNIFAFIHSLKLEDKIIGKGMNVLQSCNQVRGSPVIFRVSIIYLLLDYIT
jgi:hypothetical protein